MERNKKRKGRTPATGAQKSKGQIVTSMGKRGRRGSGGKIAETG